MAVQAPHQSGLPTRPVTTSTGTMTSTAAEGGASRTSLALASSGTLRLRAVAATDRHIQWAEDVIDNEGMGKKSSKVCCIYHAPRAYDESSDESSSSSDDSDSESEPDNSTARPAGRYPSGVGRGSRHGHHHHDHNSASGNNHGGTGKGKAKARASSPNAYEKMPKHQSTKKQRP